MRLLQNGLLTKGDGTLNSQKKNPERKRAKPPRDAKKADIFLKDWEKLSHSELL